MWQYCPNITQLHEMNDVFFPPEVDSLELKTFFCHEDGKSYHSVFIKEKSMVEIVTLSVADLICAFQKSVQRYLLIAIRYDTLLDSETGGSSEGRLDTAPAATKNSDSDLIFTQDCSNYISI